MAPTLGHDEARAFYDRFGARQDWQRFYEDPAIDALVRYGAFADARAVLEFGCGTGRFARRLLRRHLGPEARYVGVDSSATMVALARARLAPWAPRATVLQTDGSMRLPFADRAFDRFVATYVCDLLSEADIRALVAEAARVLVPEGRLCVAGLTVGRGPVSRLTTRLWQRIHAARPALLGGCRPVEMVPYLAGWRVERRETGTSLGIAWEAVIARPPARSAG